MSRDDKRNEPSTDEGQVWAALRSWRAAHPRATMREIEDAVEGELYRLRGELVEDLTLASSAHDLPAMATTERPRCEVCGSILQARGQRQRTLENVGGKPVRLRRSYAVCPTCGVGLFPPR